MLATIAIAQRTTITIAILSIISIAFITNLYVFILLYFKLFLYVISLFLWVRNWKLRTRTTVRAIPSQNGRSGSKLMEYPYFNMRRFNKSRSRCSAFSLIINNSFSCNFRLYDSSLKISFSCLILTSRTS